jgi:vanillate/3-O-methylgallate O-demethylase
MEAGKEFGIRQLGGRAVFINHLEACFPTIVTDYLPAIFGEEMKEYFGEFQAAMPAFAVTFNLAGSFEADDVSAWYRSPLELGWANRIKFDHDFIGRKALEEEVAHPRRAIRTLVWNADDIVDVYASLFRQGKPHHYMEMPRDQRGFMYADKGSRAISRGRSNLTRLQLLLPSNALTLHDRRGARAPGTEVTVVWGNPASRRKRSEQRSPSSVQKDNRRIDVSKL